MNSKCEDGAVLVSVWFDGLGAGWAGVKCPTRRERAGY